jgi:hypothetical protein
LSQGPLALEQDQLTGMHGNTHLPVVVGLQQRFELTGGYSTLKDLTLNPKP